MPRILHVSDTHLGYQAYTHLTAEGLNQREVDAQEAFRRVVDAAVAHPPDLFLHTGDFFDQVRPSNRAIAFALQQVRRLSEAHIPTLLVSGNHDAPRLRETGSIFRVFEGLPHVHPVYRGEAEAIRFGNLIVHAVPQAVTQEAFQAQLEAPDLSAPGLHVLATHGTVLGVEGLFSSEFNEQLIPASALRPEYAYVALGHFHGFKQVAPNAYYAGSTESTSISEAGQAKVFLDVEVEPGTLGVRPRPTGSRPMRDLGHLEGRDFDLERLTAAAKERLATDLPPGAIVRLTLDRVPRDVARTLDLDAIRRACPRAFHVDIRLTLEDDAAAQEAEFEVAPLATEFDAFLARRPLPEGMRTRVRDEATRLLADARGRTLAT